MMTMFHSDCSIEQGLFDVDLIFAVYKKKITRRPKMEHTTYLSLIFGLLVAFFMAFLGATNAADLWSEDFETDGQGSRYTASVIFTDGATDYFTRTDGSNISGTVELTGPNNSFFWAGQDLNGEGDSDTQTITFNAIDIFGHIALQFKGLFAEDDDGSNQDWDRPDIAYVEYQIDGGDWTKILQFAAEGSGPYNGEPRQDTNFDGSGDGAALTDTFTEYTANISDTGSSLVIKITVKLNSGDEDIAFDYFRVAGDYTLPVSLSAFTAIFSDHRVHLKWRTQTEVNNIGFSIYRSGQKDGEYTEIAFVTGAWNSAMPIDYQFTDPKVEFGKTYFYYLEDIDVTGERSKSKVIKVVIPPAKSIPTLFGLFQNYPNPFNPGTWMPYQLAENKTVIIRIYDVKGRIIRTQEYGQRQAGYYVNRAQAAYWDGKNATGQAVSSGVYFYQLKAGEETAVRRMLIVK
jgi:hypothetical protein